MKTSTMSMLFGLALGAAGLLSLPALAADGESGPAAKDSAKPCDAPVSCGEGKAKDGACGGEAKCSDGDGACGAKGGDCAKCVEGAKEGKECCVAKKAAADLQVVSLAVLHAEGEGAKAVVANLPAETAKKVEAARAEAWTGLVKVRRAMEETKAECKSVSDEAKAAGKEVGCEVTSAYEEDLKALHLKAREILDGLAAVVKEAVGADRVAALAEGVRKDGDVAKAVMAKVHAEAAKPVEAKSGCCGDGGKKECGEKKDCEVEMKECEGRKKECGGGSQQ